MEESRLKRIVEGLVREYGEEGARVYIGTGDYSYELKTLALNLIRKEKNNQEAIAATSDFFDIENPWGSQFESYYYAS